MRDHEEKDKLEDVESVLCTFLFSLPLRPALTFSCFLYLPLSGGVELMVTFSELDYQSDYPFIMGSSGSTSILLYSSRFTNRITSPRPSLFSP